MAGKYQAYPEYKDSVVEWLDKVPVHWTSVPIKYMALEKDSLFLDGDWIESKDLSDDGIRYITTGNVGEGEYKEQGAGYITEDKFHKIDCTEVFEGDVLISRLNSPIGRSCIVPDLGSRIVTSVDNVIFRPDQQYSKKYVVHLFSSQDYFKHTGNLARGATMQRISRGLLGNIRVVVPTFGEQEKIANFLDHQTAKIDTLIEKQQQLIKLLQEKRQAVISHAVTKGLNPDAPMRDSGDEWLCEVPEHWVVSRIGFYANKVGSGKTPKGGSEIYQDEGILFLRSQNIYDDGLRVSQSECVYISSEIHEDMKNTSVKGGDVLLNITGGSIGRTCLVPNAFVEANVNQHVCILRFADNINEYLSYVMKANLIKDQIESCQTGGNREGLNFEQIAKLVVCIPPEDERCEILDYIKSSINKYDQLEGKAKNAIEFMQERRTGLISAAVTGKIDVRGWQSPEPLHNKEEAA